MTGSAGRPHFAIVCALLTPFRADGAVALDALRAHVELLLEQGVDGLLPCGSTGEGPLLSEDEVAEVVGAVVDVAGGRALVMAHVGRVTTEATVRLAQRAIASGAGAVTAVTPWYYPLDSEQIVAHYRALRAAAADTPTYAYAIPRFAGNDISPDVARALGAAGLAGLKDSTQSAVRHREYLEVARERRATGHEFEVYVGDESLVREGIGAGAAGCVLAFANHRADLLVQLRAAVEAGADRDAAALQAEISRVNGELSQGPVLAAFKRAVASDLRSRGIEYLPAQRAPLGVAGRSDQAASGGASGS